MNWINSTEIKIYSLKIWYEGRKKASHSSLITCESSKLQISNVQFSGGMGRVIHSDGFRITQNSVASLNNCSFVNWHSFNGAALDIQNSNITFTGYFIATNNTQGYGATLSAHNSILYFEGEVSFNNNVAYNGLGGTLFALASKVFFEGKTKFLNNSVGSENGGGIYCVTSCLESHGNTNFTMNSAKNGGGVYAMDSDIHIFGTCTFLKSNASADGGGIALLLIAIAPKTHKLFLHSPATITFDGNRAEKIGGGLFIYNSIATQCGNQYEGSCFFKIQATSSALNVVFKFLENSAGEAGAVVHGGFLEDCKVEINENPTTNSALQFFNINSDTSNGFSSDPNRIVLCDAENHTTSMTITLFAFMTSVR